MKSIAYAILAVGFAFVNAQTGNAFAAVVAGLAIAALFARKD